MRLTLYIRQAHDSEPISMPRQVDRTGIRGRKDLIHRVYIVAGGLHRREDRFGRQSPYRQLVPAFFCVAGCA